MLKKFKLLLLLPSVIFYGYSTVFSETKVLDKTIATVNGENILLSEFNKIADPIIEQYRQLAPKNEFSTEKVAELKKKVLDQMIDDRLIIQEAKAKKTRVTKRELDNGIAKVKSRFESDDEFQTELRKEGITEEKFQKRIEEQLMAMQLIDAEVKSKIEIPEDDEAKKVYDNLKLVIDSKPAEGITEEEKKDMETLAKIARKSFGELIRARHILIRSSKDDAMKDQIEAKKRLGEIQQKINAGEDFEELAQKYSQDPGSRERGGDLGYFSRGDMVPEFENAAFALNVGQISDIIRTEYGYHLIKIEEKKAAQKITFELLKNDLKDYIRQKKAEKKYSLWLKTLRGKASIKTNPVE
ncbi:MAG: peptidylprolyl isomerase [Elusimicrobiota bacterium]